MNNDEFIDYTPPTPFSDEERHFLAALGWSKYPVDKVIETLEQYVDKDNQAMASALVNDGIYDDLEQATDAAVQYLHLKNAGTDLRRLTWDWE